ncbi:MAG: GNAT family N-acetyltransferase, partial [Nocardia sp.]|nr:GNAT family N-acetyltransferase [Nocardia sp.]
MSGSGDIPLGRRVVVRYRLPEGSEYRFTDVIGALISDEPITVRTDNDVTVTVDAADLVAIKAVGPRPIRIGDIRALESAAIDGWPGLERARYDGWLCSAGNGYSGRANSAVPLGDSGHNAGCDADTLHVIGEWYTSQGLPLQVRVPDRLAPIPEDWRVWGETLVLGVDIRTVVLPQGPSMVRIDDQPDDAWLELHHQRGEDTVAVAAPKPDVAVLTAVRDG